MTLRKQARETLSDVTDASKKIVSTSEWATVALVAVSVVSILALGIGILALHRSGPRDV